MEVGSTGVVEIGILATCSGKAIGAGLQLVILNLESRLSVYYLSW